MQPSTDQRRGNDSSPATPASSRGVWRPRYAAPSPTPAAAADPRPIPTYVPPHHRNNTAPTIPTSHAHHRNTNYRQTPPHERPYPSKHNTSTTIPRRGPPQEKPTPAPANTNANPPSAVPQLVQEIQDKLARGAVECMICYDMVGRSAPVWSCASCFSIFHLACTRKWARSPASASASHPNASDPAAASWRCPGCQSAQGVPANDIAYTCFCGRRRDPPNDLLLTPHSCGHRCSKPLAKTGPAAAAKGASFNADAATRCPHVCVLQCHPGPCPPCKGFAPERPCPCGKQSITRRCADWTTPLTCGQQCERLLPCGRHPCERVCHTGPCGDCQVNFSAHCFCGRKTETILCGEMAVKGELSEKEGVFSCGAVCGHDLACGNHACRVRCHPGPCGECELVPEKVITCHCGKTRLQEDKRASCLDPIPTCDKVCDRKLPCGVHRCKSTCHEGKCPPCLVRVEQRCRCGSSGQMVECYIMASMEEFRCSKPCGRKKNCGRHRCSECCCLLSKPFAQHEGDSMDPHFCLIPCGKMLRCGQHGCQHLCHSGHCDPCRETIFHDLTCACGRTSVPPPQPCGTPTPSCPHKCTVSQPCGHPASHQCHSGDCPPCVVPVMRECIGGHVLLRNIPCGSKDIRCNRQCGLHPSPRDPARAATALRCLDYGSAYQGDAMFCSSSITQASSTGNVWVGAQRDGGSTAKSSANPWNKAGASEPGSSGDSTVLSHSSGMSVLGQVPRSAWRRTDTHSQVMGTNKLTALESPASTSSSSH